MKLAVIGAGLFGATTAIIAARAGHEVHLFDGKREVMGGASRSTFARLHRGYHYPRSPETGRESRLAEASFRAEYGDAVIDGGRQTYIVADTGRVLASDYRRYLDRERLPYEMNGDNTFEVVEPRLHIGRLAELAREKLTRTGVVQRLGKRWDLRSATDLGRSYDAIIVASYARNNAVLGSLGIGNHMPCKFQAVEVPIISMPGRRFAGRSIVVLDGPFGCIDPYGDTNWHLLGHVIKSVHAQNVGMLPRLPAYCAGLLDQPDAPSPHSRFAEMVADLAPFIPGIEDAQYRSSMWVLRAVLAHCEDTDWRPTLVEQIDDKVFSIFSGKLGTAVDAAERCLAAIENRIPLAA